MNKLFKELKRRNVLKETIAYLDRKEEAYQILNEKITSNFLRSRVFAALEERDSMYYYFRKGPSKFRFRNRINSIDFNPYGNEAEFQAIQKMNFLHINKNN